MGGDDTDMYIGAARHAVVTDRPAKRRGGIGQDADTVHEPDAAWPEHASLTDTSPETVRNQRLLEMQFRPVGKRGDLSQADAVKPCLALHVVPARVGVEEGLHIGVDERLEAHQLDLFGQGCKRTWLVALGL